MTFLATLFQTLVKIVIITATAFGGIMLGKVLREKKDKKDSE